MDRERRNIFYLKTWEKLIYNARKLGLTIREKTRSTLEVLAEYSDKLLENKDIDYIMIADVPEELVSKKHVVFGIDSSEGGFQRVGGFIIVPIASSYIKYEVEILNDKRMRFSNAKKYVETSMPKLHDGIAPSIARYKTELKMLEMETRMMDKVRVYLEGMSSSELRGTEWWIFIDGPIIDPPNLVIRTEDDRHYMEERASMIASLHSRGTRVIGYVKRIMGMMWYSYLDDRYHISNEISEFFHNDWSLATIILSHALIRLSEQYMYRNTDIIVYTKPLTVRDRNYSTYEDYGLSIYYAYILIGRHGESSFLGRIDFVVTHDIPHESLDTYIKKILLFTYLQTPLGLRYPLPVHLAHITCNIPRKEAQKLVRETIGKTLFESLKTDPNLTKALTELIEAM